MFFQLNITNGGYFAVLRPDLVTVYTLERRFSINSSGAFVTAENYVLISPVTIPAPFTERLAVSDTGQVSVLIGNSWAVAGQIMATVFMNPSGLQNIGNEYYTPSFISGPPTTGIPGSSSPLFYVRIYYIYPGAKKERPLAVLDVPGAIADFILKSETVVQLMGTNMDGYFTNVTPALATVTAALNNLKAAESLAGTRATGSAAERNKLYIITLRNLQMLQSYVQQLADVAADVPLARAIIDASGLGVKRYGVHAIAALQAKQGKAPGTILLKAKAVKGAGAYEWEKCLTPAFSEGEGDWIPLPATTNAKTTVTGLTAGAVIYFRCRAVMKEGVGEWSDGVKIVVI